MRELMQGWRKMFVEMEDLSPYYSTLGGMVGHSFYCLILGVEDVLKVVGMYVKETRSDVDYMGVHLH
jgi:hypothetical protein